MHPTCVDMCFFAGWDPSVGANGGEGPAHVRREPPLLARPLEASEGPSAYQEGGLKGLGNQTPLLRGLARQMHMDFSSIGPQKRDLTCMYIHKHQSNESRCRHLVYLHKHNVNASGCRHLGIQSHSHVFAQALPCIFVSVAARASGISTCSSKLFYLCLWFELSSSTMQHCNGASCHRVQHGTILMHISNPSACSCVCAFVLDSLTFESVVPCDCLVPSRWAYS